MSIENKRKADDGDDGGPEAKARREADNSFGREAQEVIDAKIADGTVCDPGRRACLLS